MPNREVGTREAIAEVQSFAAQQGLDATRLCRSCAGGAVPSPCVSLCTLDDAGEFCRGCGRSVAEITGWREFRAAERAAVRLRLRR